MQAEVVELSPAEKASKIALEKVEESIIAGQSFKLEAGAGAGKTYSLVEALKFLIATRGTSLAKRNQRIACITFTNVAKDEIASRTDRSPVIHCDTIHAFCWSVISGFQSQLRQFVTEIPQWNERLEEIGEVGARRIEYSLGHRSISDDALSIHHDDVLTLAVRLTEFEKFRRILASMYPYILIDEYQDTDAAWMEAVKERFLGDANAPQFAFFGDHWQKIYGTGCGNLEHPAVREIGKEANFRSVPAIVKCLNRMRPELPQEVKDPDADGQVVVFHTNDWPGMRETGYNKGDLPGDKAVEALSAAKELLTAEGWDFEPSHTKILMLTHRVLAAQQGYSSLPVVFRYNESFTNKEQPHIAFFVDQLEPARRAFEAKRFGEMFDYLGTNKRYILRAADKATWSSSMSKIMDFRTSGTVGDVLAHLREQKVPPLPSAVERLEQKLAAFDPDGEEEMPRNLQELRDLHDVPYSEIVSVTDYLEGHSPFETKHGVKGAQFENVLAVMGRGWNRYNWDKMLANAANPDLVADKDRKMYEDNRNLFYVACSRPQRRLAVLFTQELSDMAMQTVRNWFGEENVRSLPL